MKIEVFKNEMKNKGYSFVYRCLLDEESIKNHVYQLIHKGNSIEETFDLILNDETIKEENHFAWAEISKKCEGHWYRVRSLLGNDVIKTYSDIGSIALCDDEMNFCSYISNNYGDGTTRVKVFEDNSIEWKIQNMMKYHGIIEGKFNLLNHDCAFENHDKNNMVYHFDGRYAVYVYEGMVVFVKWK